MSRPFKLNETPTAAFNLRETGPLTLTDVNKRLRGATYRTARGANPDTRATVDPSPCPHCSSLVEWSTTARRDGKGEFIRYVYARCRGSKQHRWSFGGMSAEATPPTPPIPSQVAGARFSNTSPPKTAHVIGAPRPTPSQRMTGWIERRINILTEELEKLKTMQQLANDVVHMERGLFASPRPSYPGVLPNPTPV